MILSAVNICYDPSHQPFAAEGAVKIQNLNSERAASKILRAVLRDSDIDPQEAVNYSIHRCYCNPNNKSEDQIDGPFNPESTLDELEIRGGDSVFIRKIEVGEEVEGHQDGIHLPPSKKRKERDEDEVTSQSSLLPAAPKSKLENLEPQAARIAGSISKLLGGETWKIQSIGNLGMIQTKGLRSLHALHRAIKTSLQIPQIATIEAGSFNSDLVEALIRAYRQRIGPSIAKKGDRHFSNLSVSDYERANELLKGKLKGDGICGKSSLAHLEDPARSQPISRFPLSDSGLSGSYLNAARAICVLWNNDEWLTQAPLPGLSPISLKHQSTNAIVRQIAQLTRIKPGEATPDGYPPIVLQAFGESIKKNEKAFKSNKGRSQGGWAQTRCLKDALALLKERVVHSVGSVSSSTASGSSKADESDEAEGSDSRAKRRKIAS